jgi:2-phosphosulfolactate phosphatase
MVATVKEALALRAADSGPICMGEVGGQAPPGFDYGNSPFEIATVDLRGRTIIQRTSAGTQGVVAATAGADRLYAVLEPGLNPPVAAEGKARSRYS